MMGRNNEKKLNPLAITITCAIMALVTISLPMTAGAETAQARVDRLTAELSTATAAVETARQNVQTKRTVFRTADRAFGDGSGTRDARQEALRELRQAQQEFQEAMAECRRIRAALNRAACGPECQRQRRLRQQRQAAPPAPAPQPQPEPEPEPDPQDEICDNGVDDDGDGDVDCEDSDCADLREYCEPDEEPAERRSWCSRHPGACAGIIIGSVLAAGLTTFGIICGVDDDHCGGRDETNIDINVR